MQLEKENLPWIEKYRPKTFDNLIINECVLNTIRNYISLSTLPHLFLYGPSGTGKTSFVLSIVNSIYNNINHSMVLNINASDEESNDNIRKQIENFATTSSLFQTSKIKLVIVDEIDSMGMDIQNTIKDIIDSSTHTKFCLIGNNQYSLQNSLLSRMCQIMFPPIQKHKMIDYVKTKILSTIEIEPSKEELNFEQIYDLSKGDFRKFLNISQALLQNNDVNLNLHSNKEGIHEFTTFLFSHNLEESYAYLKTFIRNNSLEFRFWIRGVYEEVILHIENERDLIDFCIVYAEIEHMTSFVVKMHIQIYAFINLLKKVKLSNVFHEENK